MPTHLTRGVGFLFAGGETINIGAEKLSSDAVTVHIPVALRPRTAHRRAVTVDGKTVREVIGALEINYPGFHFHVCHETGELRPFVNVFLQGENIRFLQGLDTQVPAGATVHIIHSVAGG